MQAENKLVRWALMGAMGLNMLAILASYSRGALIGLLAVGCLFWIYSRRKFIGVVVFVALIGAGVSFMPESWLSRMNTIETYQEDASATTRLTMWITSWRLAVASPLTGAGFMGPYTRSVVDTVAPGMPARAVHSIWFELLGEHGFPTFFIWFGITISGLVNCRRIIRETRNRPDLKWATDLARMASISITAYLVAGTFLSLSYWDVYFTILVALAATYRQVKLTLNPEAAPITTYQAPGRSLLNLGGIQPEQISQR